MTRDGEPLLRLSPQEREELEEALRKAGLAPRLRERLEMVKAADMDFDLEQIAAWSRRTPRTVRRWLAVFSAEEIEALLIAAGQNIKRLLTFGGRRPKAPAQVAALRPPDASSLDLHHAREHRIDSSWRPARPFLNSPGS